jgi:hypothetical protein
MKTTAQVSSELVEICSTRIVLLLHVIIKYQLLDWSHQSTV